MEMIDIFDKTLKKWGIELQLNIAIEEAAEFIKAVLKMIRHKEFKPVVRQNSQTYEVTDRMFNLIDEIADLTIMIRQINRYYRIHLAVKDRIGVKMR